MTGNFKSSAIDWGRIAVVLVLVLVFTRLAQSFWIDETGMIAELRQPFALMVRDYTRVFPMLSLYEMFMWLHGRIWGYSEVAMRMPSVLAAAVILFNVHRSVGRLAPGTGIFLPSVVLLCMEPVTGFLTSARPYAITLAALSFSIWHWLAHVTDDANKSTTHWWKFCAWGAMAAAFKIFAIETPLILLAAAWILTPPDLLPRRRDRLAGSLMILLPALVQIPMLIHFNERSTLHSYRGQLAAQWLLDFLVYSLAPPAVVVVVSGLLVKSITTHKGRLDASHLPRWTLAVMGIIPVVVTGTHLAIYLTTGAFVIHSNYIIAAYLPAAIFWASSIARIAGTPAWKSLGAGLLLTGAVFQAVTAVQPENWRRAINLVNAREATRNPVVLIQAGFYENAHPELLPYPLLSGPAIAYPVRGTAVAIPSNLSEASRAYLERIIRQHGLDSAEQPLMLLARSPSILVAQHLADRLGKQMASLEQGGIIVFEFH